MAFAPKAGCPMCGTIADAVTAVQTASSSTPHPNVSPDVLWKDDNFTAYRESVNPVSSKGHIIIAFNFHVPSLYHLSSSDLPLLASLRDLAKRLLSSISPPTTPGPIYTSPIPARNDAHFRIGFITPPFRDSKIPVTGHLHAHAYIAPADLLGWWRGVAYSSLAWYAIDDLIAEIRESVSNNRVKSGYEGRTSAPIDSVPEAGARTGFANGNEHTIPSIAVCDKELGES
ncbi:hypothetical protein BKA82DRAFT_1002370 [Pisolithus tinctorius]|uniref:HIT domain-containing protein n=1 Tax=Pisolithus tinctorius Marx 270 TaxID=870435 RepID=A0A0C3IZY3_PISTI|nr:hypothetical protein BKA82DRAFT_1002370 [Pisolithus tinctorius]KIO02353.1 hypothetical protein M404DRAFT_1002370 [Pisolithus tinctorius Marx 270]